ncbi:lysosomal cholesterol signaling protein isoform X2 [Cherax quadricarinatus]|uniref:lysosomal cholesterol signaling protein isoform X2 n=1 Tax=Cherax quadricarinatus TaxID=27406 RepID=UPI00237968F2|nr:integral membrane protein GPR155-like isoform X2 [Cherax quadricarinatus]
MTSRPCKTPGYFLQHKQGIMESVAEVLQCCKGVPTHYFNYVKLILWIVLFCAYGQLEFLKMNGSGDGGHRLPGDSLSDYGDGQVAEVAFSNLYPAVIECFLIILCGYVAGRCNLISQTESKGLNTFVGTFSLPSLIFVSMAHLDFSSVNWMFLLAICISKACVFFLVILVTLMVYRPVDFGKAGLFAIFCTQSNDFALGYPIIAALYGKTHPEFALYLYLVAPISLVLLNPIGFILMEVGKRRKHSQNDGDEGASSSSEGRCRLCLQILRDVLLNPIVLMTTLGIMGNFIFNHKLPNILEGVLKVFGQAFSAAALFLLGLRMVGKVQTLRGSGLVIPSILIATKTLFLPLTTRLIVGLLHPGNDANETADFSNYGFLYGTFPTAPGVFVFASQYNIAVDLVASAMVACTFLSAPLMFVSAKMVTLVKINPMDYVQELESVLFNVSILGLICTSWVLAVFCLSRKWNKVPHFITMCLALSQGVACLGALLWSVLDCTHTWKLYLQFVLFSWGVFSSRLWTAILAITLFLLRWRSLCFVLRIRPFLAIVGWGLPAVLVTVLILMVQQETDVADKHDPNFQYGAAQAIVALLLLWFSLITTVVCLIFHQRHERRYSQYESLLNLDDSDDARGRSPGVSPRTSTVDAPVLGCNGTVLSTGSDAEERTRDPETGIDGNLSSDSDSLFSPHDDLGRRYRPDDRSDDYSDDQRCLMTSQLTEPQETTIVRDRDDEFQMMRHVVLLLLLCGSMIVGFALCMWTLVTSEVNGVYVELVFLDIVLNFGQGFFTAAIFGLDTKLIVMPLLKWWRQVCHGAAVIKVPAWDQLDPKTRQTCEQFTNYHMDKCINDIVRDRRWRLKNLAAVFGGKELVDWLLMVGLAHDRTDAVKYGRQLLQGGIIRHIDNLHHFHDQPLFYTFRFNEGAMH